MTREIDPHRGAAYPRFWPYAWVAPLVAFAITFPLVSWYGWLGIAAATVIAAGFGWAFSTLRWALWRRRHPLRPCGPGCVLLIEGEINKRTAHIEAQREHARWQ